MNFKILYQFPQSTLEQAWRKFLTRVEVPSHYNAPEYFHDPLRRGECPFAVLALEGDEIHGVLTGFHLENQITCGLLSRPQICVDDAAPGAAMEALVQGLLVEAQRADLVHVYAWQSLELAPFSARGFRRRKTHGSVVLDLTRGPEAIFSDFTKDRRRNIRFAEKNGVEVREAVTEQDIVDAHAVYSAWRDTDRKQIHGDWGFESFRKTVKLTQNRRLFLATVSGKVVAINIFRFFPGGLFESAANSSIDEFTHLKPNDLLQWRGIQWACAQGLRRHSLGGAHEFLLRFGGTVAPIFHYRLDRTLFRRHDLRENLSSKARSLLRSAPPSLEQTVQRIFKRKWPQPAVAS